MNVNDDLQPWKVSLGKQIREARGRAGLSQKKLGDAIGRFRQSVIAYESGSDAPHVDVLGKIALALKMPEVQINGYRFWIAPTDSVATPPTEQLKLDFDKE